MNQNGLKISMIMPKVVGYHLCTLVGFNVILDSNPCIRAVKTGWAVRAGPFSPINYKVWDLNIEPEFE